ncbi:hypothetical protein MJA45_23765 [Paenibacillus aurantius]|uniref:Uncharacterized protein n=1 Tax=Paenibacillus aurantius TaxID=2918900 RepID=A0AA96RH03_9BACL|nr:hypothetical protein [Paenibacillus aurantius]WNQ10604.1 hypothetical protein MJA45_23765 [Paenibacillus aurantius]
MAQAGTSALILTVCVAAALAWSPWLSEERAARWAAAHFHSGQKGRTDACGVVGTQAGERRFFARKVTLFYRCGLLPSPPQDPPQKSAVYVTGFGAIFR